MTCDYVTSLTEAIGRIPATAFVAMLAFLGTIAAVLLTNWAASKRLARQFAEERAEATRSRLFESRRDIYLEAADAVTVGLTCIGRLADLDRPVSEITKLYEDGIGRIARIHLVADNALGDCILKVSSKIASAIIELTVERVPLAVEWNFANGAEGEERHRRLQALMPKHLEFALTAVTRSKEIAPLVGKAVMLIRADLDMAPYASDFPDKLAAVAENQVETLRAALDVLRAHARAS